MAEVGPQKRIRNVSRADLENTFQRLAPNSYELSSPKARRYNCIAWASKDITRKWDCFVFPLPPAYHWPKNAIFGDDLNAFVSVFIVQGYELCPDGLLEDGYEKVVLYVDNFGEWQHAARQLVDGRWTSKMGDAEDITHQSPDDLGG